MCSNGYVQKLFFIQCLPWRHVAPKLFYKVMICVKKIFVEVPVRFAKPFEKFMFCGLLKTNRKLHIIFLIIKLIDFIVISRFPFWMATTLGSLATTPRPLTCTNVLAVPRSMAKSVENDCKTENNKEMLAWAHQEENLPASRRT